MAGNFFGADVEQLRQLSRSLAQCADQVQGITTRLSPQVDSTPWRGADADRFRGEWNENLVLRLNDATRALADASGQAERNANQQEQASSGGSGSGFSFGANLGAEIGAHNAHTAPAPIWPFTGPGRFSGRIGDLPLHPGFAPFAPGGSAGIDTGGLADHFRQGQSPLQHGSGMEGPMSGMSRPTGMRGYGMGSVVGPWIPGSGPSPQIDPPKIWRMESDFSTPLTGGAMTGGVTGSAAALPPIAKNFRFW